MIKWLRDEGFFDYPKEMKKAWPRCRLRAKYFLVVAWLSLAALLVTTLILLITNILYIVLILAFGFLFVHSHLATRDMLFVDDEKRRRREWDLNHAKYPLVRKAEEGTLGWEE
jgi:hypothetical protein